MLVRDKAWKDERKLGTFSLMIFPVGIPSSGLLLAIRSTHSDDWNISRFRSLSLILLESILYRLVQFRQVDRHKGGGAVSASSQRSGKGRSIALGTRL